MKLRTAAFALLLCGASTLPPNDAAVEEEAIGTSAEAEEAAPSSQDAAALAPGPSAPAEAPDVREAAERSRSGRAAGAELFYSTDSDGTQIVRAAANFDVRHVSQDDHLGLSLERAWYRPANAPAQSRERAFVRAAGDGDWQWRARVGTDGDTLIGFASINDRSRFRKEFFVERDIVETRQGLERGLYATFAGAGVDLPADERNIFTALIGAQEFTGDNLRLHLRGSYIHVLKPEWGLSAQVRGRYFSNSRPREFDYYSPRWFAEALPVVQLRRVTRTGWELIGAAGLGLQRDAESDWRQARYAHARFRSPSASSWAINGAVTYTNTPSLTGSASAGYSYVQFNLGVSRSF